jgi:activator of HSP90 ATPase
LIAEHGKDIQHAPGSNPANTFAAPKYVSSSHVSKNTSSSASGTSTTTTGKGPSVNVTTINDSTELRTSAAELYTTFTDVGRITAFTRSSPLVFEGAKPGGKFELFGGNVSGSYTELEEPKLIVQKWRLAQWPQGHYSTLKIEFEQNNVDHVTVMKVTWEGVPAGQEEVTKRNWGEYYVRSIKQTFGFGTIL